MEEQVIVQHILDLDSRAFPPRVSSVEDMANRLLRDRSLPPVGKKWTSNFIKRHQELRTRLLSWVHSTSPSGIAVELNKLYSINPSSSAVTQALTQCSDDACTLYILYKKHVFRSSIVSRKAIQSLLSQFNSLLQIAIPIVTVIDERFQFE